MTTAKTQKEIVDVKSNPQSLWMTMSQWNYVATLINSIYPEKRLPSTVQHQAAKDAKNWQNETNNQANLCTTIPTNAGTAS